MASVGVLVVLVAVAGLLLGRASRSPSSPSDRTTRPSQFGGAPAAPGVASQVELGVVDVNTVLGLKGGAAAGTGLVLTSSGEVLTNNHVVEGATSVSVTDIGNGRSYTANVVGTDKKDDIAVLSLVGASGLETVALGDSAKVTLGDAVTAIGNAGGTGGTPTITTGHVTGLNQAITASDEIDGLSEQLTGLLQTDASLQPGDSGGPLADNSAHVVGIDTAASAGFQFHSGSNVSYSIPIDHAIFIARQIEAGIPSSTIHIGPAALLGVLVQGSGTVPGAPVVGVENDSPAALAGIAKGDIITSLGGQNVGSPITLSNLMQSHHPGDDVTVTWVDPSGQHNSSVVHLATGPAG